MIANEYSNVIMLLRRSMHLLVSPLLISFFLLSFNHCMLEVQRIFVSSNVFLYGVVEQIQVILISLWWAYEGKHITDLKSFQAFGRTPLTNISPKKTWEGALAGLGGCIATSVVLSQTFCWPTSTLR